MNRPSRIMAAGVALSALLVAGLAAPQRAEAHFFHHGGYGGWGYGWGGPWFHPRPWLYPRVVFAPPPPRPLYVVPRVAFIPPPVYGYGWRFGYGYRWHHYYRHAAYRHVVHPAVHHRWCTCHCCR